MTSFYFVLASVSTIVIKGNLGELENYHDAAVQVVEDCCLKVKLLPSNDGVGEGEIHEERLEHSDFLLRSQTETLGGQTENLRLPGGDGVWNGDGKNGLSRGSGLAERQIHSCRDAEKVRIKPKQHTGSITALL